MAGSADPQTPKETNHALSGNPLRVKANRCRSTAIPLRSGDRPAHLTRAPRAAGRSVLASPEQSYPGGIYVVADYFLLAKSSRLAFKRAIFPILAWSKCRHRTGGPSTPPSFVATPAGRRCRVAGHENGDLAWCGLVGLSPRGPAVGRRAVPIAHQPGPSSPLPAWAVLPGSRGSQRTRGPK